MQTWSRIEAFSFRRFLVIVSILFHFEVPSVSATTPAVRAPVPRGESDKPLIAYYTDGGLRVIPPRPELEVVLAIWADGRILWASDLIEGGTPYFEGKIDLKRIQYLLRKHSKEGYFENPGLRRLYYGPDATKSTIAIASGTQTLTLVSWHELAERNPKVLGTSIGLVPSEGKTWEEIADKEPEEYVTFRRVWKEIRTDLLELIPKEGGKEIVEMEFELR